MFEGILLWLQNLANDVPLPLFVMIGGIVEEIVAPIPSPVVNGVAGSIARVQGMGIPAILWICFLSAVAKTAGAWIFYVLGDKFEDAVVPRFGKLIGVKHEDLEHFGGHFDGTLKDDLILFVLRAIPVMPSTPVSLICGILKITMRTYLVSTLAGFFVRGAFFTFLGFSGIAAADALFAGVSSIESMLTVIMLLGVVLILAWLYVKRGKVHPGTWLKGGK